MQKKCGGHQLCKRQGLPSVKKLLNKVKPKKRKLVARMRRLMSFGFLIKQVVRI